MVSAASAVEYRRVTAAEFEQVARFVVEAMHVERYPLHFDGRKMRERMRRIFEGGDGFHLAAFDGPRIVGGVAAVVQDMAWFERCEAHVVQFRALDVWVGMRLLRELMRWFRSDMRLRRVLWAHELGADPAMALLARRAGFTGEQILSIAYKG